MRKKSVTLDLPKKSHSTHAKGIQPHFSSVQNLLLILLEAAHTSFGLVVLVQKVYALVVSLKHWYQEPKFLIKMSPRRSEGEESEYPFFEGDGSSSDEWRDYGMASDDYEGPPDETNVSFPGVVLGVEEESMLVYDTDIEDAIEDEEGFVGKRGFGKEEDNMEDVVVMANDLCSSKIQTVSDDFSKTLDSNPHELILLQKGNLVESGVRGMILAAQSEAFKQENILAERLHGLDQQMEKKEDESLYFMDRIWVLLVGGVRTIIMDEAHKTRYSVHPGADKMYHDL
ncbi:hypothetical protein Tco_0829170 [Tanacetum coccineum]